MTINTVTFTDDTTGRVLCCKYWSHTTPGFTSGLPENCYPGETEVGDPEYFLNGDPIDYNDIPTDLQPIADEMYEADEDHPSFEFSQEDDDRPDDDGSDPEYD